MSTTNSNQEVTTIQEQAPQTVITKTVKNEEPQAKGEAPQGVYETKKIILRFNQIIWYILGLIEILLIFRIALKALGANPDSGFTNFIYVITSPFSLPFKGILQSSTANGSILEWSTIVAGIVYYLLAWGFIYLLDLVYPITPKDVEAQTQ